MFHFMNLTIFPGIKTPASPFKGILLDAYGVFWGGTAVGLLPGAKNAMENLIAEGKIVGILSNSTQLVAKELDKLQAHGILQGSHFHFLLTSGQVARDTFLQEKLPFTSSRNTFMPFGKKHPDYSSHSAIFQNTIYTEVADIDRADFLYISIPHINGKDQTDPELFLKEILEAKAKNLPMVCANPDLFAEEGSPPKLVVRQGSIASLYKSLGGEVFYIGKPHEKVYIAAMSQFQNYQITLPSEILMVGDTPETDIRGANNFGMSSALTLETGVMSKRAADMGLENALRALPTKDIPNFLIRRFISDF